MTEPHPINKMYTRKLYLEIKVNVASALKHGYGAYERMKGQFEIEQMTEDQRKLIARHIGQDNCLYHRRYYGRRKEEVIVPVPTLEGVIETLLKLEEDYKRAKAREEEREAKREAERKARKEFDNRPDQVAARAGVFTKIARFFSRRFLRP